MALNKYLLTKLIKGVNKYLNIPLAFAALAAERSNHGALDLKNTSFRHSCLHLPGFFGSQGARELGKRGTGGASEDGQRKRLR